MAQSAAQPAADSARIVLVAGDATPAYDFRKSLGDYRLFEVTSLTNLGDFLAAEPVDLVLLDLDALDRQEVFANAVPVCTQYGVPLLLLASPLDPLLESSERFKAFDIILRPQDTNDLKAAVGSAINRHKLRRLIDTQEIWSTAILRTLGEALIVADPEGHVVFCSAVAQQLVGVAADEATGKTLSSLVRLRDEHNPGSMDLLQGTAVNQLSPVFVATLQAADGAERRVLASISPASPANETGRCGSVLLLRDVSNAAKTEQAISDNNLLLNRSYESLEGLPPSSVPPSDETLRTVNLYSSLLAGNVQMSAVEAQRKDLEQIIDVCRRTNELLTAIEKTQRGDAAESAWSLAPQP